jgi:hypothetical protein
MDPADGPFLEHVRQILAIMPWPRNYLASNFSSEPASETVDGSRLMV